MASNISVAITVDNKQYIANIKAADSATQKFATDTERSLNKAGGSFDTFTRRVGGLRTALAGLAFGAVGRGALGLADNLQDLSNSSGIAVARLIEFQNALATSGGEAESLPQAINTLLRSIDEAAGGSVKAQNSFKRLGIDLKDLGTLSEQDLLKRTLEGIVAIENPSRRAAEMMDKFGKSFKTVDPQELLDKLNATAGSADRYVISIARAAELNDKLTTAQNNLKLAFIEAFSGPIQKIIDFNDKTAEGADKMQHLINVVKVLGVALVAAFSASALLAFVASLGTLLRGLSVITAAVGLGAIPKALTAATGAAAKLLPALRAIALVGAAVVAIFAANEIFDDFGSVAVNALQRIGESVLRLGADLLDFVGTPIQKIMTLLNGGVDVGGAGQGLTILADKLKKVREDSEYIAKIGSGRGRMGGPTAEQLAAAGLATITTGGKDPVRPIDTTATDNALKAIRDISAEYEKQRALTLNKLDLETSLIGKTQEEKQLIEAQNQLAQDFLNVQDQLIKKRDSLSKEDKEQGAQAAAINEQIKKNAQAYDGQLTALNKTVAANQHANMVEKNRLQTNKNIFELIEQQAKAQEEIAGFASQQGAAKVQAFELLDAQKQAFDLLMRREELERGILNLREQDKTAATQLFDLENERLKKLEEIRKMEALPFEGVGGMKQRLQEINDLYDARGVKIKETQARTTEEQNSFSFGWAEATEKYRNSITTNADYAGKTMQNFTKGIEDVFVKFVQTGKLSFKDLANSMIADFARIQAQKALSGIFNSGGGGGGGILGALGSFFGMGGGITGGGGGGAMANGGQAQGNTPYLIGERGPELFIPQNAGKIVPNHALGGGSSVVNNTTEVTYSIQAMDASSFRSMLARDPEFIHNVAEQGRRQLPIRSRR
jgi:lambda family phage tail tape measure protein